MLPVDDIPALSPEQRDAWLQRIGIDTAPPPTLPALNTLITAHLAHIPFENLDALLRQRVAIDPPAVFDKLVHGARGGYCFELNTLFGAGLKSLGYRVVPLAARVRWNVPVDTPTGLSHMLLRVEVEHESHIADVGFGGPTPDRALPLSLPVEPASPYRLQPTPRAVAGTGFHTYDLVVSAEPEGPRESKAGANDADAWRTMYRFDLTPQPRIDFVARNWYVSTHPDSHFTQSLIAARTEANGTRLALANGNLSERLPDGTVRKTRLDAVDAIVALLENRFGLQLDDDLRAALQARLPGLLAS